MANLRKEFAEEVKKRVVAPLRERGFKGTYPTFYRINDDDIAYLHFRFGAIKIHDRFFIDYARFKASEIAKTYPSDTKITPARLSDYYHRNLSELAFSHFINITKDNSQDMAQSVLVFIDETLEPWWQYQISF